MGFSTGFREQNVIPCAVPHLAVEILDRNRKHNRNRNTKFQHLQENVLKKIWQKKTFF